MGQNRQGGREWREGVAGGSGGPADRQHRESVTERAAICMSLTYSRTGTHTHYISTHSPICYIHVRTHARTHLSSGASPKALRHTEKPAVSAAAVVAAAAASPPPAA